MMNGLSRSLPSLSPVYQIRVSMPRQSVMRDPDVVAGSDDEDVSECDIQRNNKVKGDGE